MTMTLKTGVAHRLPKFSALEYRFIGNGRWKLTRHFIYFGDETTVVVPSGFVTDLDSVPRVPFFYAMFKGFAVRSATIHDSLYKKQRGKAFADRTFLAAMAHEGIPTYRRYPIYWGVVAFGQSAYDSYAEVTA
jgi:hypothetical protein